MWAACKLFIHDLWLLWDRHGTKLIAAAGTLLGGVAFVDPQLLRAALGERWAAILLLAGGLAGYYRGLRNTQTQLKASSDVSGNHL